MYFKNTTQRYGIIAQLFHWIMALLLIGLLVIGLYMVGLPIGLKKLKLYGLHKEFGILILMLVMLRLLWRATNINPPLPISMPSWQKFAAISVHILFYILMFSLPITGWMLTSASGLPVSFFGLFVLPDLVLPNEHLRAILVEVHHWLAYGLIAALCGHVGAALQHHFIDKDDIFRRMLP
jgi:cytochrome b561